jgi:hypothetical protein
VSGFVKRGDNLVRWAYWSYGQACPVDRLIQRWSDNTFEKKLFLNRTLTGAMDVLEKVV